MITSSLITSHLEFLISFTHSSETHKTLSEVLSGSCPQGHERNWLPSTNVSGTTRDNQVLGGRGEWGIGNRGEIERFWIEDIRKMWGSTSKAKGLHR